METLDKIGFKKNWIYESVVTTTDGKNPNAAPMGIFTENFKQIKLEVYKSSKTCENILASKEFIVNFVDNLEIFFSSVFSKKEIEYKPAKKVKAKVLSSADSWLELKVKKKEELKEKFSFTAEIIYSQLGKVKLINRAAPLTLESLIKSTKKFLSRKELEENYRIIKKVAPNSKYEGIIRKILQKLS